MNGAFHRFVFQIVQDGETDPTLTVVYTTYDPVVNYTAQRTGVGEYTINSDAGAPFAGPNNPRITGFANPAVDSSIWVLQSEGETALRIRTYASPGGALTDGLLLTAGGITMEYISVIE